MAKGIPCVLAAALAGFATAALAQAAERPRLQTNQVYVEELARATSLDVADPIAVFGFVFESLPDRVKVYPTENYFYFTFVHDGAPYDGNIRLDASDRDEGKVHFGYSETLTGWRDETPVNYVRLDAANGVRVEKLERFLYRVTFRGKSILFELNDLSKVKPPAESLGADEQFIGPVFDESGMRFFLLYNSKLKLFHYILDETGPVPDQFVAAARSDRILTGKRTGFAFFVDERLKRKILIGVYERNANLNTYFDGPFDQLPDNFVEGDLLRRLILEVEPDLAGKIDRFGSSFDGAQRYMIAPYLYYQSEGDLLVFDRCARSKRVPAARYYACFVIDDQESVARPVPRAMKQAGSRGPKRGGGKSKPR